MLAAPSLRLLYVAIMLAGLDTTAAHECSLKDGGALRRGGSMAAGEFSPRTSNTAPLSLSTCMVLASTHVLKNGWPRQ